MYHDALVVLFGSFSLVYAVLVWLRGIEYLDLFLWPVGGMICGTAVEGNSIGGAIIALWLSVLDVMLRELVNGR